jgi:farnesyl-diphosphate farnesyltransferase
MADLNSLLKGTARSLYLSAQLLPKQEREAFSVAYLLCRYADTIADTSLLPADKRLYWVSLFPDCVAKEDAHLLDTLTHQISSLHANTKEAQLLCNLPPCVEAFSKLSDSQKEMILEVINAVCEGMEIDLKTFPDEKSGKVAAFTTPEELKNYCRLMGGAPGKFWSKLLLDTKAADYHPNVFLPLGTDIGDGLQIVNILRDLPRDLRIGRCYIPSDDLVEEGIIASDLLKPQFAPQFEPVKRKWIAWARKKLMSACRF